MTQLNLEFVRGPYWWDLLGHLGRIHRVAQDIDDWAKCSEPSYLADDVVYRREYMAEWPPAEESGVRRIPGR